MVSDTLLHLAQGGSLDFTKLIQTKPADDFMFFLKKCKKNQKTLKVNSSNWTHFEKRLVPLRYGKFILHVYLTSRCLGET